MLKKLRIKFVVTNMLIMTIMLGIIFGTVIYTSRRSQQHESLRMLQMAQENKNPGPAGDLSFPGFSVDIQPDGAIGNVSGRIPDSQDTRDFIEDVVSAAEAQSADSGILSRYNLRFLKSPSPQGERFSFLDSSMEQSSMKNLLVICSVIGGVSLVVFLFVFILLARWAVRPVEKAWQQQKQFAADASHELKTPLTVIMTDAELLSASDCPEADREKLSSGILTMSKQMKGLVEELLDLARVDSVAPGDAFCEVPFSDIVSDAVMIFEPVFFESNMPFEYDIEPGITLSGNAAHLKQLTDILLDNAKKYALPGGETLVKLSRSGHKKCILQVADRGEPIPPEEINSIFARFYRADKARTRNHSYGLGLSIAQSIVQAHRGRLWAESSGGYNRFFVEIPTAK